FLSTRFRALLRGSPNFSAWFFRTANNNALTRSYKSSAYAMCFLFIRRARPTTCSFLMPVVAIGAQRASLSRDPPRHSDASHAARHVVLPAHDGYPRLLRKKIDARSYT